MLASRARLRILIKSRYFQFGLVISVFLLMLSKQDNLFGKSIAKTNIIPISSNKLQLEMIQYKKPGKVRLRSVRILCYILLSSSKLKTALLIKETWGAHCDDILFFGGFQNPDLPVTYLNISEGYEKLWGKAKAALLYLAGHSRFKGFQYFLKADDDTFVIVENLRKFLSNSTLTLDKPMWLGFKLKHRRMLQGYMSGGAGYVFNYKALEKVKDVLKHVSDHGSPSITETAGDCNFEGEYGIEDLELGKCFHAAGVESVNTNDRYGKERFLPVSYDGLLNGAISSYHWIWRQAWNRVKTGEKCCSEDLISMHEISPSQMKLIYYLLYKTNIWKGQDD